MVSTFPFAIPFPFYYYINGNKKIKKFPKLLSIYRNTFMLLAKSRFSIFLYSKLKSNNVVKHKINIKYNRLFSIFIPFLQEFIYFTYLCFHIKLYYNFSLPKTLIFYHYFRISTVSIDTHNIWILKSLIQNRIFDQTLVKGQWRDSSGSVESVLICFQFGEPVVK